MLDRALDAVELLLASNLASLTAADLRSKLTDIADMLMEALDE